MNYLATNSNHVGNRELIYGTVNEKYYENLTFRGKEFVGPDGKIENLTVATINNQPYPPPAIIGSGEYNEIVYMPGGASNVVPIFNDWGTLMTAVVVNQGLGIKTGLIMDDRLAPIIIPAGIHNMLDCFIRGYTRGASQSIPPEIPVTFTAGATFRDPLGMQGLIIQSALNATPLIEFTVNDRTFTANNFIIEPQGVGAANPLIRVNSLVNSTWYLDVFTEFKASVPTAVQYVVLQPNATVTVISDDAVMADVFTGSASSTLTVQQNAASSWPATLSAGGGMIYTVNNRDLASKVEYTDTILPLYNVSDVQAAIDQNKQGVHVLHYDPLSPTDTYPIYNSWASIVTVLDSYPSNLFDIIIDRSFTLTEFVTFAHSNCERLRGNFPVSIGVLRTIITFSDGGGGVVPGFHNVNKYSNLRLNFSNLTNPGIPPTDVFTNNLAVIQFESCTVIGTAPSSRAPIKNAVAGDIYIFSDCDFNPIPGISRFITHSAAGNIELHFNDCVMSTGSEFVADTAGSTMTCFYNVETTTAANLVGAVFGSGGGVVTYLPASSSDIVRYVESGTPLEPAPLIPGNTSVQEAIDALKSLSLVGTGLDDLTDVVLTPPLTNTQSLVYDDATLNWVNRHPTNGLGVSFINKGVGTLPAATEMLTDNALFSLVTHVYFSHTDSNGDSSIDSLVFVNIPNAKLVLTDLYNRGNLAFYTITNVVNDVPNNRYDLTVTFLSANGVLTLDRTFNAYLGISNMLSDTFNTGLLDVEINNLLNMHGLYYDIPTAKFRNRINNDYAVHHSYFGTIGTFPLGGQFISNTNAWATVTKLYYAFNDINGDNCQTSLGFLNGFMQRIYIYENENRQNHAAYRVTAAVEDIPNSRWDLTVSVLFSDGAPVINRTYGIFPLMATEINSAFGLGLNDVDTTGLSDRQILQYDLPTTTWRPVPLAQSPIGECQFNGNAVASAASAVKAKVNPVASTSGLLGFCTSANNSITYTGIPLVNMDISFTLSFQTTTPGDVINFSIFKNGIMTTSMINITRVTGGPTFFQEVGMRIFEPAATNDVFEVFWLNETTTASPAGDIVVDTMQILCNGIQ